MNTPTEYGVHIHAHGGPQAMQYEPIQVPPPGPREVQIRQHAVGVNYLDIYHRRGVFPIPSLPAALGVEAAGEVVAVGRDVQRFKPGDRVAYACPPVGSYVSLRNLPDHGIVKVPSGVSDEQAAAATLQGITAHMLLHRVAPLRKGQTIVIHAAAGGLGSLLTQWARRFGVRIIGVVGSEAKAGLAASLGCDDVIVESSEPLVQGVRRLTDGEGVDVVFEGLGGRVFHESLTVLKPFGHLVNLGQAAEGLPAVALSDLGPARSLTVSVPGVFAYVRTHPDLQSVADDLYGLIASGGLRVGIGGRFALKDAKDAHRALESRGTTGSLVLLPERT